MKRVRCAIYTRKSSEEGLEQDFNSLDAQREACGAYVLSQASEGWSLTPEQYDDGGISGGTLERPALQRLLADIDDGKIDIVVVYKVDRLTRSLLDFSKLVEAFDKAGTSFVSVTQSFNTTTSMGRLTLNMLLSFAQFEREVTAERIRDKIAASKAKGMWMGGTPPLGYAPDRRSLKIVDGEAKLIRMLFQRSLEVKSVPALLTELNRDRITLPVRTTRSGRTIGGTPFQRGPLYHLLKNPIYVGDIRHRDRVYPGNHPAIVERTLWDAVQALLADNRQGTARRTRATSPSLLAGRLIDEHGEALIATHASKQLRSQAPTGKVRYRYYVRPAQHDRAESALRIPAAEIERAVADRVADAFDDPLALIGMCGLSLDVLPLTLMMSATAIAVRVRARDRTLIEELVKTCRIMPECIAIECHSKAVATALGFTESLTCGTITLDLPVRLTRSGHVLRLVDDRGCGVVPDPSQSLVRLIAQAHRYWRTLRTEQIDVTRLAKREGVTRSYLTRVLRLAFLAPSVVDAVISGSARADADVATLTATDAIPISWVDQAERYLAKMGSA